MDHIKIKGLQFQTKAFAPLEITDESTGKSEKLNVSAVISCPRWGFTDHHRVVTASLSTFQIPLVVTGGAWWEHGIQCVIDDVIKAGADLVITLDFDSIFFPDDLNHMLLTMVAYPEVDALVPIQLKRGNKNDILCGIEDVTFFTPTMVTTGITPIDYGHFGLTIFRAKALKEIPKPWFLGVPNPVGDWKNGQTNPDIYFWKKFKEHGKKAALANTVRIGHIDEYLVILDENNQIKRYKLNDYMLGKFDKVLSNE